MNKKVWVTLSIIFIVIVLALILFLNRKVVVTFDSNGGSNVGDVTIRINTSVSKPINPTREGYNFVMWMLDDKEYDFSSKVSKNITLKAAWEKISSEDDSKTTYEITLEYDGKTDTIKVSDGKISSLPVPEKDGYNFVGWFNGNNEVKAGDTVTGNMTLKARFEKKSNDTTVTDNTVKYSVTFDSNGGSKVSSQTVVENGKAKMPKAPTKTGYTFSGWTLDGKSYDFGSKVTKDITLVASWKKNAETKEYTVTFDSNGGSSVKSQKIAQNAKASEPVTPTREGYKFLGWYLNDKLYSFNTAVTKNITLTAKWEKLPELTYSIEDEPGSVVGQVRIYILADNVKVAGSATVTTNTGKKITIDIPVDGFVTNKAKVVKVEDLKLK